MATVRQDFDPDSARFMTTSFPRLGAITGTSAPIPCLQYDAAATQDAFWRFAAFNYGSGNLTLDVLWYADTASSGVTRWDTAIAAITPETDTQDVETKALAASQAVDDTHLGTVAQRLHRATITIANVDAIAALDYVWLRISRLGAHANDTMTGYANFVQAQLSYSDT
jgi:hypothetical protein